jgi:TonB family protein
MLRLGQLKLSCACISAIISILIYSSPAKAQQHYADVGDWEVYRHSTVCVAGLDYEFSRIRLIVDLDGRIGIAITDNRWAATIRTNDDLSIVADPPFNINAAYAPFATRDLQNGIAMILESPGASNFTQVRSLTVYQGGEPLFVFMLDGWEATEKALSRCLGVVRKSGTAYVSVLADPSKLYLPAFQQQLQRWQPPRPRTDPWTWIGSNDYPTPALQREYSGVVYFKLAIDKDGKVIKCEITESSGMIELDQHTCALMTIRGNFFRELMGIDDLRKVLGRVLSGGSSLKMALAPRNWSIDAYFCRVRGCTLQFFSR